MIIKNLVKKEIRANLNHVKGCSLQDPIEMGNVFWTKFEKVITKFESWCGRYSKHKVSGIAPTIQKCIKLMHVFF